MIFLVLCRMTPEILTWVCDLSSSHCPGLSFIRRPPRSPHGFPPPAVTLSPPGTCTQVPAPGILPLLSPVLTQACPTYLHPCGLLPPYVWSSLLGILSLPPLPPLTCFISFSAFITSRHLTQLLASLSDLLDQSTTFRRAGTLFYLLPNLQHQGQWPAQSKGQ